ncbi:hypothetical protein KM043_014847 [Ampulex compressa]|nr:hypothetical protein KM043_014847 [Ampulex compressa]
MRRPLIRHLSEGGGGAGENGSGRRQQQGKEEERAGYTWSCREYGHHLSTCDLLKVPNAFNCRGHATSPEPRITIHRNYTLEESSREALGGAEKERQGPVPPTVGERRPRFLGRG